MLLVWVLEVLLVVQVTTASVPEAEIAHYTSGRQAPYHETPHNTTATSTGGSPFASIVPSETLEWFPCKPLPYANNKAADDGDDDDGDATRTRSFECARLLVPFDYSQPNSSDQFSLAVVRARATDKQNYKGPMFVNFGGPGLSGTEALPTLLGINASKIGSFLGAYDLVSWDPRAVGSTLPALACFKDEAVRTLTLYDLARQHVSQSNDTVIQMYAIQRLLMSQCEKNAGRVAPYIGTMYAAQDLRRLNEVYGYSDRLSYLGLSYGTHLGFIFAGMYPDKIERMILDGVVDSKVTHDAEFTPADARDIDAILEQFFEFCFLAGQSRCPFWLDGVDRIRQSYRDLEQRLRDEPYVPPFGGGVIQWQTVRNRILRSLYDPPQTFPLLSVVLAGIRNDSLDLSSLLFFASPRDRDVFLVDPVTNMTNNVLDANPSIRCSDRPDMSFSIGELEDYLQSDEVTRYGPWAAHLTLLVSGFCSPFNSTGVKRFEGPFEDIKTSNPVLLVSSRLDPVTPLANAYQTSTRLIDSAVLVNNISAHIGLKFINDCMLDKVSAYLEDATLPENNTFCQPDVLPFSLFPNGTLAPLDVKQERLF